MIGELMGICFSCRRSRNRLNSKICEHISGSVTPLHVCVEEPRRRESNSCHNTVLISQSQNNCSCNKESQEDRCEEDGGTELYQIGGRFQLRQKAMANTISNMKMTNPLKGLVSKRRKRFTADGFNLDLTYIKDNLIAMGYPAEKLEGVYRNHIDDVVKFLESKHKDHYKIYNLCSERSYDSKKFKQRVATYAFDDHNPPSMELIKPFCEDVHEWLTKNESNVAVVHCKAGKGRTGVMVCCYLLYSKQFRTAAEALNFYGTERTTDRKGVTIPSQRRYVNYFSRLVTEDIPYHPVTLALREIKLDPAPTLNGSQGYRFVISEANKKIFSSETYEVRRGTSTISIILPQNVPICGDIKVDFYNVPKVKRKEKLFHFWFNTFFVREYATSECDNGGPPERTIRAQSCDGSAMSMIHPKPRTGSLASLGRLPSLILTINKWEIDGAHKDKHHKLFSADFKVSLLMHRLGSSSRSNSEEPNVIRMENDNAVAGHESASDSSAPDSSECDTTGDEDGWESGESSASMVEKRHSTSSHTHGRSHSHSNNPSRRSSLREAAAMEDRRTNV